MKQIVWNLVQQLNTQHIFHPLTQNTIKSFKSRAQVILNLLEKAHHLVYKIWVREIFSLFYIISTQKSYIVYQKLDTNSCFAKLRAISNLFIHPVYTHDVFGYIPKSNEIAMEIMLV
jgi:hypothetical protein